MAAERLKTTQFEVPRITRRRGVYLRSLGWLEKHGSSKAGEKVKRLTWPDYAHSPANDNSPTGRNRADRYYFTTKGEIMPTPKSVENIASNLLCMILEPRNQRLPRDEDSKLTLVYRGDQPGSKAIYEKIKQMAIEKYGVKAEDIVEMDRHIDTEKNRLRILRELRESNQLEERTRLLKEWGDDYYAAVERVMKDNNPSSLAGYIEVRESNPTAFHDFPKVDTDDLAKTYKPADIARTDFKLPWTVGAYPHPDMTPIDSAMNPGKNITYEEEINQLMLACERPLPEVLKAQEKLARLMNRARQLRVIANSQDERFATDVTFGTLIRKDNGDLVPRRWFNHAGFEFNFPGSEVYGAPSRESGNGRICYPFPVTFDGHLLPNLIMEIRDGKVINWEIDAKTETEKKAAEHFAMRMNDEEHPDNRYFGEIGIGTNPYPDFHVADIGMQEKRTGVHFALGKCYREAVDEAGHIADLDNGNNNAIIHADLVLPSTKHDPLDLWVDIGTEEKPEWLLVMRNGAFVEKVAEGEYRADPTMTILNALDVDTEQFSATFPQ